MARTFSQRIWLSRVAVLLLVVAAWTGLTAWNFGLPGLYMDEVNHYAYAPGILDAEAAKLPHYRFPDNYLDNQDHPWRFPILGGSIYNSVIRPYAAIPFFAIFGYSVESIRAFTSLFGLAAALVFSGLVGRIFGLRAALLSGVLVAIDPSHVLSLRSQGGLFWLVMLFLSISGHALLSEFRDGSARVRYAVVAGFGIALAVASYFVAAFLAIPLLIYGIVLFRRRPVALFAFIAAGVLSYSPVLYSLWSIWKANPNLLWNMGVPTFATQHALSTLSWTNALRVLDLIHEAIGVWGYARNVAGETGTPVAWLRTLCYALVLVFSIWQACFSSSREERVFFLAAVLSSVTFILASFALKSIGFHHWITASILFYGMVSALCFASRRFVLMGAVALIIGLSSAVGTVRYQSALVQTGGVGLHNIAVHSPSSILKRRYPDYHPIYVSWGFHLQHLFLTRGQAPYSFMGRPNGDRLSRILQSKSKIAVIVSDQDLDALVEVMPGGSVSDYPQSNGRPLFHIVSYRSQELENTQQGDFEGGRISISDYSPGVCEGRAVSGNVAWNFEGRATGLQIFIDNDGDKKLWTAPGELKGEQRTGEWLTLRTRISVVDSATGEQLVSVVPGSTVCPQD